MADGEIEKEKVLGLKQSSACFVVHWLIAGPKGPAIIVSQPTFLPSLTSGTNLEEKQQTFMFDDPLLEFHATDEK